MEQDVNPNPRGNVTTLLNTLKTARSPTAEAQEESAKRSSQISPTPQPQAGFSANAARRFKRQSQPDTHVTISPSAGNQTARSFFLPDLSHINDFVSGTLKWSSVRNGTPIFVKHGKVFDRETMASADHHADFEAIPIPYEEEEIFVSLDKIREEIQTLQDHDVFISKQAEDLQDEVRALQNHIIKLKTRKDSAMGSESDGSMILQLTTQKSQLEEQLISLRAKLEQVNRQVSLNEIHNQSFVVERDQALQRASDHVTTIKRLQNRNDAITKEKLELQQALRQSEEEKGELQQALQQSEEEKGELQQALQQSEKELTAEQQAYAVLQYQYEKLGEEKKRLAEEKIMLKEDHHSLEHDNNALSKRNNAFQQGNHLLERENGRLLVQLNKLQDQIDDLKLAQQTCHCTRGPKGFTTGQAKTNATGLTQANQSKDRRSAVAGTSSKATSHKMYVSSPDNDTRESDFTRESRQNTQESRGSAPAPAKSRASGIAQMQNAKEVRSAVSGTSAKATSHKMYMSSQDNDTRESDFTRESRQYTQESRGSVPATSKSKMTRTTQMRGPSDRNTVTSETSAKTTTSTFQTQDDYTQRISLPRESQYDSDDDNMTSALFIDDVTLDSNKKFSQRPKARNPPIVRVLSPILSVAEPPETEQTATGKQKEASATPGLTQCAKGVLDNLCRDHECYNCTLCARMKTQQQESSGKYLKRTVRVDRPVPVTDRVKRKPSVSAYQYEDQPTLRPSQDPGIALAKVLKGLEDEERHLQIAINDKQSAYDSCNASHNKTLWKRLDAEIRVLRQRRDLKRDQIYDLNDVLEGQKANAQTMSQDAIDVTITSVLSKDPTWNGVLDY
ncbi:hypothetical protein GGR50DRAFT_175593 [Xylaria sp. CBS 124048]|nr:hypothetical protein GGR50DRAFT_175593 [Xylaria sp. CBS 124048]